METKQGSHAVSAARAFKGQLLDLFFPPVCLVCDRPLLEPESEKYGFSSVLCEECVPEQYESQLESEADEYCTICGEAGDAYGIRDGRCLPCILAPLGVERVRSLWRYAGRTEQLLKCFKYGRRRALAEYLALALIPVLTENNPRKDGRECLPRNRVGQPTACGDLLVAVPSPGTSLRARGFSHLGLLLRLLSRELSIPSDIGALRSTRNRQPQAGLHLSERAANVAASCIALEKRVSQKRIFLIDDVLTTGSSLSAAARALKKAGAKEVIAVTLARSPRFQTNRLKAFLHAKTR